jgi:hypothetical protein
MKKFFLVIFLFWFVFFLSRQSWDMIIIIPFLSAMAICFFLVCQYEKKGAIAAYLMVAFIFLLICTLVLVKIISPTWEIVDWQSNVFGLLGIVFLWLGVKKWASQKAKNGRPSKSLFSYFIFDVSANNLSREILAEILFSLALFFLMIFGSCYLIKGPIILDFELICVGIIVFVAYVALVVVSRLLLGGSKVNVAGWIFFIFFRLLSIGALALFIHILQTLHGN